MEASPVFGGFFLGVSPLGVGDQEDYFPLPKVYNERAQTSFRIIALSPLIPLTTDLRVGGSIN